MNKKNVREKLGNSFREMLDFAIAPEEKHLTTDSSSSVRYSLRFVVLSFALSYLVLVILSFAMLWAGDKINASGMVLTRFLARAQAPITAQYSYPETARDQIAVVMYDAEFLTSVDTSWPITYQDHADWLLRLAGEPNARPKAIFLDITFGQNRNDPTLPALQQALCTVQNELKIPVFLAALPSPDDGQLKVRSGLSADPDGTGSSCFTLVGVDYLPDSLDGLAWTYPLSRHRTEQGWSDGPAIDPSAQPSYRSAAMAMAQDAAHIDLGAETGQPMSLIWGHNSAPQIHRPDFLEGCQPAKQDWKKVIPGVLRQFFWEEPSKSLCPYHQTLSMAQVAELPDQELAPYLAGRYVMVGANVPGYNDFVDSPVHRLLPGVHLHAMALDNFLTYQGDYKVNAEWTLRPSGALLGPALLCVFIVWFFHVAWSFIRRKRSKAFSQPEWCRSRTSERISQRMVKNLGKTGLWGLRLLLQSLVALLLIALLQRYFRIGMLPVAELVGMTIVAESINYMKNLRTFIYGERVCPRALANTFN